MIFVSCKQHEMSRKCFLLSKKQINESINQVMDDNEKKIITGCLFILFVSTKKIFPASYSKIHTHTHRENDGKIPNESNKTVIIINFFLSLIFDI